MRLTIRSIIRWEQLNQKPFSELSHTDENDIASLFYVCMLSENKDITLSEFKDELTEDSIKKMIGDFERQTRIAAQFQGVEKKEEQSKNEASEGYEPVYIKDIVPILIMNGLNVRYAMDEMELYDIPIYMKAYDHTVRNRLESSRLWTFIQVSPHLSKNIKSPKDLYPFTWEVHEDLEKSKEETEKGLSMFEAFMKSKKK